MDIFLFLFFILYVHIRGKERIRTSDLRFMKHNLQPIELPVEVFVWTPYHITTQSISSNPVFRMSQTQSNVFRILFKATNKQTYKQPKIASFHLFF